MSSKQLRAICVVLVFLVAVTAGVADDAGFRARAALLGVPESTCGDAAMTGTEECDDGNTIDNDGCRSNCLLPRAGAGDFTSDDFADCPLDIDDGLWMAEGADASAFSGVLDGGDALLAISVPENALDFSAGGGVRLKQPVGDPLASFELEIKLGELPAGAGHDVGLFFEAADGNTIRVDVFRDSGLALRLFVGYSDPVEGVVQVVNAPVGAEDEGLLQYLRVTRVREENGTITDRWSVWVSRDGATWALVLPTPFDLEFEAAFVGVYASNPPVGSDQDGAPFTALIDYALNLGAPFDPAEDAELACDDGDACTDDACTGSCESTSNFDEASQCCDSDTGETGSRIDGDGDLVTECDTPADCDDDAGDNYPGNTEICDGKDNDCDGSVDEGLLCDCGNGTLDGDEQCDDGFNPPASGDGCDDQCLIEAGWQCPGGTDCAPICGDGLVLGGEGCDDGNTQGGDGCSATCTLEDGWDCSGSPSVCSTICGDGLMLGGEQCDDDNLLDGDGCDSNCTITGCGNWIVTAGEQCDDGNTAAADGCSATCQIEICGNGTVDPFEQCDDGNTTAGDGCSATCRFEICGNGLLDANEQCDDGNTAAADGCDAGCILEICGNGVTQAGESCDDGNPISGDGCDANCTPTGCGNGVVTAGEECDDGNTTPGDGCGAECLLEQFCGNGIIENDPAKIRRTSEECDDGNDVPYDGCTNECTVTNFVKDGGFDLRQQFWFHHNTERFRVVNGVAELTVGECRQMAMKGGPALVQLLTILQPHLEGDTLYRLYFDLKQNWGMPLDVRVKLYKDTEEFENYYLDKTFQSTMEWQTNHVVFRTSPDGRYLPEPRLTFWIECPADENGDCEPGDDDCPQKGAAAQLLFDNVRVEKVLARCGDGHVQYGEQCDPKLDPVNCTEICEWVTDCGNGLVDPGEECDDAGPSAECDRDCTWAVCGDSQLNELAGEWCDDGDLIDVDLCTQCMVNPNAIQNGDFSLRPGVSPLPYWFVDYSTVKSGGVRIQSGDSAEKGGNPQQWIDVQVSQGLNGVQLAQSGLILQGDTHYELTFYAKNDSGQDLRVKVRRNRPPMESYGLNQFVNLTPAWQKVTLAFTTPPGPINDARLELRLITRRDSIYSLRDFQLRKAN